jgi:hypothetical protein
MFRFKYVHSRKMFNFWRKIKILKNVQSKKSSIFLIRIKKTFGFLKIQIINVLPFKKREYRKKNNKKTSLPGGPQPTLHPPDRGVCRVRHPSAPTRSVYRIGAPPIERLTPDSAPMPPMGRPTTLIIFSILNLSNQDISFSRSPSSARRLPQSATRRQSFATPNLHLTPNPNLLCLSL